MLSDLASESISRATRQSESWQEVIDESPGSPLTLKITCFVLVSIPTLALVRSVISKSKRLPECLDSLSDERLGTGLNVGMLLNVWRAEAPVRRPARSVN